MQPHAKARLLLHAGLCVLVAWSVGCQSLREPSPGILAQVAALGPEAGALRRRANVELETGALLGNYTGAAVLRAGPSAAARLQLLPSVGPKLLDLAIDGDRISGYFPAASVQIDHARADGPPPRHLLSFLAASLLEQVVPLDGRVRGVLHQDAESVELLADGALEGVTLRVRLDAEGQVTGRTYRLRRVTWTESVDPSQRVFRGRGFGWTLTGVVEDSIPVPGDGLFRLELPAEESE